MIRRMPPRGAKVGTRLGTPLLLAALAFAAFALNWTVAQRGLFFYDYSIVFDGGWRIVQGQVPYRDFFMAQPPGVFLLMGAFFKLAGVSFASFAMLPSILNAAGALAAYGSLSLLCEGRRGPALLGGLLTAIWLHPPTGVLMVEQAAYTFNLVALFCAISAARSGSRWADAGWAAAGACWAMAAWTKQNAGLFFLPVLACAIPLALQRLQRGWAAAGRVAVLFAAGVALVSGPMLGWLWLRSDLPLAWHHMVEIPSTFAAQRMSATPRELAEQMAYLGDHHASTRWLAMACYAATAAAIAVRLRKRPDGPAWLAAAALPAAALASQVLFSLSMLNEPENALAYLGLAAGAAAALAGRLPRGVVAAGVIWLLAGWSALYGYRVASERLANQFKGARFTERVALPRANGLYWGEPTPMGSRVPHVERAQFEGLARYLEARGSNFFIFPVSTILYGLLQKPSPQPWLFYLEGHSFATSDIPRMDALAVANLEKHDVRIFVQEQDSWLGVERIERMPLLHDWISRHFEHTRDFGPFAVWERRADKPSEVAGVR